MKTERWVIVLSIVCGLGAWLIDAALDYFLFYEAVRGTFLEMLLTDLPPHEIYARPVKLLAFVGFGVVVSWVMSRRRQAQEALWESRRFLQTVIDAQPDMMLVIARDHRVVLANRAAQEFCECEDPVAAGMKCHQVAHRCHEPCEGLADPCPLEQVVTTGEPVSVVHVHRDARDNDIFVEINAAPIFDGQGEVVQMIESYRDVTARMRAEKALQEAHDELERKVQQRTAELETSNRQLTREIAERKEAEEQLALFQRFVEASGEGMGWTGLRGNVRYINAALCRIFGEDRPEDAYGKPVLRYYSEETQRRLREEIFPAVLREGAWSGELVIHSSTGKHIPTTNSLVVLRDSKGNPVGFANVATDLTERKRIEDELRIHRDHLEELVAERTSELEKANAELKREIGERKRTAKQLQLLSSAVQQSTEGMAVVGLDGCLQFCNQAFAEAHGYIPEELTGKNLSVFHTSGQMPFVEATNRQVKETGQFVGEIWHLRRDGSVFPTRMYNTLLRDDSGAPTGIIGTLRDITELKQTEEALRENETRFRELFDNMSSGVAVYEAVDDGEDFAFKDLNLTGQRIERTAKDELIGRRVTEAFPGVRELGLLEVFRRVWRTGTPEHHPVTLYKDERIAGWRENYVYKLPSGEIVAIYNDVTERKQAEEQLRFDELRLQALLQLNQMAAAPMQEITDFALEEAVGLTKSQIGYLAFMNEDETLLTMHAWSKTAMEQCAIIDKPIVYPIETTGLWGEAVRQRKPVITNDYPAPNPLKKGHPTGHVNVTRHMNIPVFDDERIVAVAGVGNKEGPYDKSDVRQLALLAQGMWRLLQRKRAEQQREQLIGKLEAQNAELERFTYTVSHDLKSPLITIKGYLGLLEEDISGGKDEAVKDDMGRMSRAADKMEELLDELLELSRIGRMVNPSEHVPLGELAREVVELVAGRIAERGVAVEISSELPVVFGDRSRLREVVQNLVENAVKYMGDQSRPRIEIGARLGEGEPICYVRDNGLGIDPRYHEKVFGLFDQLDGRVEGTGIGLALVKRIVEVHGGRVWVESEGLGRGAAFCFVIPQQRKTESPMENES